MTIIDIAVAVLIALYAMIGGAFLNAAITAPRNCDAVLAAIYPRLRKILFWSGIFASIAYPLAGLWGLAPLTGGTFSLPGVWIALANIALMLLLRACWYVARLIPTR